MVKIFDRGNAEMSRYELPTINFAALKWYTLQTFVFPDEVVTEYQLFWDTKKRFFLVDW